MHPFSVLAAAGEFLAQPLTDVRPSHDRRTGVYAIWRPTDPTAQVYVGSTGRAVAQRAMEHRCALRSSTKSHCSPQLQAAFDEHGEAAFVWALVQAVLPEKLLLKAAEQAWLDAAVRVYNEHPAACSCLGAKRSAETRAKMSAASAARQAALTPEQRSAQARRMNTGQTFELRSAVAQAKAAAKTPEERSAIAKRATAARDPAYHAAIAKKGGAARAAACAAIRAARSPEEEVARVERARAVQRAAAARWRAAQKTKHAP